MMEERYHATTQNRFYQDMSNVNKNITVEAKLISPPTYNAEHSVATSQPSSASSAVTNLVYVKSIINWVYRIIANVNIHWLYLNLL